MKYIQKLDKKTVYNDNIGNIELWDFSRVNENEEARKEAVCLVASISYGNEFCKNPEKLWKLLIEKGHESPFEFVRAYGCVNGICKAWNSREINFPIDSGESDVGAFSIGSVLKRIVATFKLKVPIFVARQIMRHRSFSYLEMSRRYVKDDKVSIELFNRGNSILRANVLIYKTFLDRGVKPEIARTVLPLATYTQFWMQGDYRAWLNFFIHRLHPEAQEETRLVAQAMWTMLRKNQPEIIDKIIKYIDKWTKDCNPIFTPARKKKAEWFKQNWM